MERAAGKWVLAAQAVGAAALVLVGASFAEGPADRRTTQRRPPAAAPSDYGIAEPIEAFSRQDAPFRARRLPVTLGDDQTQLYRSVAPSVVFLVHPSGMFATGLVVREGGWILTNYHVAQGAAATDDGGRCLNAICCEFSQGENFPTIAEGQAPAYVHAEDDRKDLALLRIDPDHPNAAAFLALPPIPLRDAGEPLNVLEETLLIGNAGAGFLWSPKMGHVSNVGEFHDIVWLLHTAVDGDKDITKGAAIDPAVAEKVLDAKVIESADARLGRGDSGGPLVDLQGRLVGVASRSVKLPADDTPRYFYIHYDEVRGFLAGIPELQYSR